MKISLSKEYNANYVCKIIELKGVSKHPNADSLQVVQVDFQNVITGMDAKDGDICVFFPLESVINTNFLSATNSFRDKELNADNTVAGFFENKGRVRAVKLRGERSMGYVVPIEKIVEFVGGPFDYDINDNFDTIGDILMVKKYILPVKGGNLNGNRVGKKPRISRLIDGLVHLHVDTENLRNNAYKIHPEYEISITYKLHGTSGWCTNVLVNKKLNILEKLLRLIGVKIESTEYDYIYGSRKVVKNQYETQSVNDFYDGDLWTTVKDEIRDFIPKGYTFYYEIVGYTKGGGMIQMGYDYGCQEGEHKIYVYRITFTNADGLVRDLSTKEIMEWSSKAGFNYVPHIYSGKAKDMFDIKFGEKIDEECIKDFIETLEANYTDKDCYMCKNVIPEEGIVLRKESGFEFESYKLKSFRFLEHESKLLDEGVEDLESTN